MAGSDALLVGQDWISEHFFTTDATSQSFQARVLARRRSWDEGKAQGTTLSRFTQLRPWLLDRLATLGAPDEETGLIAAAEGDLPELYARLRAVLGYDGVGLHLERTGPVLRVSAPGMAEGAPLALVEAVATGSVEALLHKDAATLLMPYDLDEATTLTSVTRTLSALFVSGDAPDFALVLAGRYLLVAEKARWAEGRYLAVDLQLVCERNDIRRAAEVDRALTCVAAESLAPDADGDVWWTGVLEESIKHTVGVSKDLREGVRLSIEILANEVVRRRTTHGLAPLPPEQAQPLAIQSLRFLYRILFLLFAEASPELGVLPVGSPEYENGYSLDRLRELILVELATPQGQQGTHLYASLAVLFRLVDRDPDTAAADGAAPEGLEFRSLRADLFHPKATAHLDEVGLGNSALQQVLRHLLLSKEVRGKDRGFISYAELGINQLGAVYEGLMSYTGFFATEDLYEVAKDGDGTKGSWVVPVTRADNIAPSDFIRTSDPVTGEERPVLHERGTFVFRLAGRDRQQSASYYTPEVLTRFVVSQALEELLDQDDCFTTAAEILEVTVCEPALGSGAFAIEAVRQLAEQYLRRRQDELDRRIEADDYPRELQRVKAFLALHQVYGVDLNATAVELAEISLWLDTMVEGLDAPWFGLHLRRGNSLIGARRATFRRDQVTKRTWLTDVPIAAPVTSLADDLAAGRLAGSVGGRVHHFLLPAAGWGSAADATEAKALAPDAQERLKAWRTFVAAKPSSKQVDALANLGYRVEALWQIALRRLDIAEKEIRRAIPLWGAESGSAGGEVQREQIEAALADANGAYQRLRRVMDAWCALWFWPLTGALSDGNGAEGRSHIEPPTLDQWIDALQQLLGRHLVMAQGEASRQDTLAGGSGWTDLEGVESLDLAFAGAQKVEDVLAVHPWLRVCDLLATRHGFFHWDLDFASVFAHGGFQLTLGNPPWVQPEFSLISTLTELDPRWSFSIKGCLPALASWAASASELERSVVVDEASAKASMVSFLGAVNNFPYQGSAAVDLYKSFLHVGWRSLHLRGVVGFVHSASILQEENGQKLRAEYYRRLRRIWHFTNERKLFEIGNRVSFVAAISGGSQIGISFMNACFILEPQTVERSLVHDGSGPAPNIKAESGHWDVKPHRDRIRHITAQTFSAWALNEGSVGTGSGPFMFAVNSSVDKILEKIGSVPTVVETIQYEHWYGIGETAGVREGIIRQEWGPVYNVALAVLQGPHLSVQDPVFQKRGRELRSHRDWIVIDPESLGVEACWVTGYKFTSQSVAAQVGPNDVDKAYRLAWRRRVGAAGIRTMQSAILPPDIKHIETIVSIANPEWDPLQLCFLAGILGSLCLDFQLRVAQKSDIRTGLFNRLRIPGAVLQDDVAVRVLRLNCLNASYAALWEEWRVRGVASAWSTDVPQKLGFEERELASVLVREWNKATPLRTEWARRQALLELDALSAIAFGLSADQLIDIYRAQFGVLRSSERNLYVDQFGRFHRGAGRGRVALDRDAEMRGAHAHFSRILEERS